MADRTDELARIRAALEAADEALIQALDKRAHATQQLVALRESDPAGHYTLPREIEIVARARELAKTFPKGAIDPVMREVIAASDAMVAPVHVAFLGPVGGFAHAAAKSRFGAATVLRPVDAVADVLEEVARGRARFGVVPLETSTDGAMTATLHGLAQSEVRIAAEVTVLASYHLYSITGNATDVEKVYGTRVSIAACERFIRTQLPKATVIDVPSCDVAVQLAVEDHGAAVLGTSAIAEDRLRVVRQNCEDTSGVETRFAVVGMELPPRTGVDRTVLALAVSDAPGSLYRALHAFADRNINLTRLESRPVRGEAFRNLFFVELDGHVTDRPVVTAIEELRSASKYVKVLGSYPRPQ